MRHPAAGQIVLAADDKLAAYAQSAVNDILDGLIPSRLGSAAHVWPAASGGCMCPPAGFSTLPGRHVGVVDRGPRAPVVVTVSENEGLLVGNS